jgi:molybdopterin-guanine dinucleotide biosynthesis protein A
MDAILIAGGRAHAPLSEVAGHSVKGLFSMHGTTLIARVLHALQQSGVERIAVVGSELLLHALPTLDAEILFAVEGNDPIDNLLRGVERLRLPSDAQFLHCAVDLPMLTKSALCELMRAAPPDADVMVAWTPESAFVQMFPGAPYTALQFAEGRFLERVGECDARRLSGVAAAPAPSAGGGAQVGGQGCPDAAACVPLPSGSDRHAPLAARFFTGRLALASLPPIAQRLLGARLHLYLNAAP